MAARPRTLREAKTAYGSNGELAWWVFMRISGLVLVFLVLGHVYFNNIVINVGDVDYNYVAERLSRSWVRIYDTFLLGFAMLHGVNGLRYSIEDYVQRPGRRLAWKAVLFTISGIVFVLGAMALWAFTYEEMGEAIRALGAN